MKKVLVIDDSDLFREFLVQKLGGFGFDTVQGINGFDGLMKLRSEHPDLVIMDYYLSRSSSMELLEKKNLDPNLRSIPVIMVSSKVEKSQLLKASQAGVRKFFSKPVKIDALVNAVGEALGVNIEVDNTPCIIEASYNDGIIFIEVARGLNRDKIELLKFRLQELVKLYSLVDSKVLVIMSGLELGANDSLNLGGLIGNIIEYGKARNSNLKILTTSSFVTNYLRTRPAMSNIQVVAGLEDAMDQLLGARMDDYQDGDNGAPAANFLSSAASHEHKASSFALQFEAEANTGFSLTDIAPSLKVAVVDDDMVIRQILKKAFSSQGITVDLFEDGAPFLSQGSPEQYDLVLLDLLMPVVDGFTVLAQLRERNIQIPVIVLSALSKRETVVKAMSLGVQRYMIKPVQPEMALKRAAEVIRSNF